MDSNEKKKFKTGLLFAAAVIILYAAVMNLNSIENFISSAISVMSPLLTGVLLSLILGTPMRKLEQFFEFINKKSKAKKKLPEKAIILISLVLTYVLAIAALTFVIGILIPAVVDSAKEIALAAKAIFPKLFSFLESHGFETEDLIKLLENIDFKAVWNTLTSNANTIINTLFNSVNGIITLVANLVTTIIFSVYLLANKRRLRRQSNKIIDAYLPEKRAGKAKYVLDLIITTFSKFFSGQCLEAIILGTIFFVVMSIAGFPYAPVISMIIGITAFIPYVGAFIGCAVGVLLIMIESPMKALIFVIVFLVIQQLENNLIYPRVVGTSIGLPAMWTFAALIVGGALYGVIGMLVFIPLASIIYTLVKNDVYSRLKAKKAKIEEESAKEEDTQA